MKRKLQRAYALTFAEWSALAEAWPTLLWVNFVVTFLPYGCWKAWISSPAVPGSKPPPLPGNATTLIWAVNAAANHQIGSPSCLRRSLALKKMLERRKTFVTLRIGVKKETVQFNAHAWVECNGTPLNESPDITATFSLFPELTRELLKQVGNS